MQAIALLPVEFRCKGAMMDGEETLTVSEGVARCKHDAVWEGQKKGKTHFPRVFVLPPQMENKSCCFMSFSVSLCPQGSNSILPAFTLICFPFLVGAKQCQWHAPQRAEAKGADGETGTQAGRVHERPEVARKAIPHVHNQRGGEKICTSNNKKIHI